MHPSAARLYQAAKELRNVVGQTNVANLLNKSPQVVKNWETRGVSKEGSLLAETVMGVRATWILGESVEMLTGETSQSPHRLTHPDEGVAHDPSVREFTLPPAITREQLMDPKFELPAVFEIAMPDDAMAPEIPAGRQLIFERTDATPRPGTRILIADSAGRRHVRRFAEGRSGAWRALPDNRAHMDLDSTQDGLQLLAVLKWVGAE